MAYALVISNNVVSVGALPGAAKNLTTGAWVCPPNGVWTDPQAATCGYLPVTTVARPADTPTQTTDYSVALVAGVPTEKWTTRAKTPAEVAATTADTNKGTLTAQAVAAIAANEAWINNTAPQVQSGVDAIQARTYPAKPAAATTIAQVNGILDTMWTNVETVLVTDLKALSQAVETLNTELVATKRQLDATMRLVAGALDSTSGT